MFGKNEIHGKKTFKHLASDELIVTSIFPTLQGEGPLSGERSVFLRLTHCLLACEFCDTFFDKGEVKNFDAVLFAMARGINDFNIKYDLQPQLSEEFISRVESKDTRDFLEYEHVLSFLENWNLVITGGEPLLQSNIYAFIEKLNTWQLFNKIQIESTGINRWESPEDTTTILVVSPKCRDTKYSRLPITGHIKPHKETLARANCLKFVVTADPDSPYHVIPQWAFDWAKQTKSTIYVSPMNEYLREPQAMLERAKSNTELTMEERNALEKISFWEEGLLDREKNRANHEYVALLCMKHNCVLSLQTHLLASLP